MQLKKKKSVSFILFPSWGLEWNFLPLGGNRLWGDVTLKGCLQQAFLGFSSIYQTTKIIRLRTKVIKKKLDVAYR